jgi:hypothetical protein
MDPAIGIENGGSSLEINSAAPGRKAGGTLDLGGWVRASMLPGVRAVGASTRSSSPPIGSRARAPRSRFLASCEVKGMQVLAEFKTPPQRHNRFLLRTPSVLDVDLLDRKSFCFRTPAD